MGQLEPIAHLLHKTSLLHPRQHHLLLAGGDARGGRLIKGEVINECCNHVIQRFQRRTQQLLAALHEPTVLVDQSVYRIG